MKIAIISAETGNGHVMVMNSLKQCFLKLGYKVDTFPRFYEDLMLSNKIMSDFYNFLTINSVELCCQLSELSYITRPDLTDDFYMGTKDKITEFITNSDYDIIISTVHSVNHVFLKILKELGVRENICYYIVVTDPYNPISIGFDTPGADYYFVPTDIAAKCLLKKNIPCDRIDIIGYPINDRFTDFKSDPLIFNKYGLCCDNRIILINSGSQGGYTYFNMLKEIVSEGFDYQIIFVCGKNQMLFNQATRFIKKKNLTDKIKIFGFVDSMQELLYIADFVITKAGANTLFECLYMKIPMIVDGTQGFLFQEQGVKEFFEKYDVGTIALDMKNLLNSIQLFMDDKILQKKKDAISNLGIEDGKSKIVAKILKLYSEKKVGEVL